LPDISYVQSDFSAGEWSPAFRGRISDKEYTSALTQCLNYIPNQEGSLSPRSGFKRVGFTQYGEKAKLLPFRFSYYEPYVAEFTPSFLRFWANGLLVKDIFVGIVNTVVGDPPTFTLVDPNYTFTDDFIPPSWADGDSVFINITNFNGISTLGYLTNREFVINIINRAAGTFTLTDMLTNDPLTGAITLVGTMTIHRVLLFETAYYDFVDDIRQVAFTESATQQPMREGSTITRDGPSFKVSYLQGVTSPRSLVSGKLAQGLIKEEFIDGPYFDSPGDNTPVTVSGTTGTITIRLHAYTVAATYNLGDAAYDGTNYFYSLVDNNTNNALPTPPAATAFWASLPKNWSNATTYGVGFPALNGFQVDVNGVPTVYYSIQAANLNHALSDGAWWATTPLDYDIATTYGDGAIARDPVAPNAYYVSIVAANVGNALTATAFWLPYDVEAAVEERYSGISSHGAFILGEDDGDITQDNMGRLIRLKAGPQKWFPGHAYLIADRVNYKDNLYTALTNNTGVIPDTSATDWELEAATILWTWGQITDVIDSYTATVLIKGDDLPSTDPLYEFRLGLYADSTGWPQCGTYHEGRLWLSGSMPNRFDAGRPNKGYDFTPTAPDGTVADDNALSYTLNAASNEIIHALASIAEGVLVCTSEREWLVSASNLNDPLTPTSIQAHPVTAFGTTKKECAILPSGVAFIQSGRRRLMEFRAFVDIASYQARLNSVDLTRRCQHLTVDGIIEACYQRIPQPVIWCLPGGVVEETQDTYSTCPVTGVTVNQITNDAPRTKLFGIGYARTPDISYNAPFSFEHGYELQAGVVMTTTSICVQRGQIDTAEYLYQCVFQDDQTWHFMEVLQPVFESSPLEDTLRFDGTVDQFGTLSRSFMLDAGVTPSGCQIALDGLSATFQGLYNLAGYEVSFTIRGKYVGDFTIAADGSVNVPFVEETFEKSDIGRAIAPIAPNATLLPAYFQPFLLDVNGNTDVFYPSSGEILFYGQFGFAYRRRGQMLRPSSPGANGPQFAKVRRNYKMGMYLDAAQEVSVGDTFTTLYSLPMVLPRTDGKEGTEALGAGDFVTGIFRDEINDDLTFNGNLCWEQTRPVVGAVLAVGGFEVLTDG
jgi:hypothetical protein